MPEAPTAEDDAIAARSKRRARIRTMVTWTISIVALALVVKLVPFRDHHCTPAGCEPGLLTTLAHAKPLYLVLAVVVYMAGIFFWAMRWRALLSIADVRPSVLAVWRISIEAQAGGVILPAAVAGDALRVAYVREQNPGSDLAKIIASILADRLVGLATLATVALLGALVFHIEAAGPLVPLLAAIPVGAVAMFFVLRIPSLRTSKLVDNRLVARFAKPMLEYAAAPDGPRALSKSIGFSLLVSGSQLLVIRILVAALGGVPSSEAWVVVGTTLTFMVAALPAAPGGWGTTDAAYVYFLGKAAIAAPIAASVCLIFRVLFYALAALGAVLNVSRRKRAG